MRGAIVSVLIVALVSIPQSYVFAVGSPSAPEYKGGADGSGQTNTGTDSTVVFGAGSGQHSIVVSGSYAYIVTTASSTACASTVSNAGNGCEFKIFDISDPTAPTYVGGGDVSGSTNAGTGSKTLRGIALSGTNAYIVGAGSATACSQTAGSAIGCELQVWDVSTPSAPAYIGGGDVSGSTNTGTGSLDVLDVAITGNNLYAVTTGSATACSGTAGSGIGCEVQLWGISTPSAPNYRNGNDASGSANSGTGNVAFRSIAIDSASTTRAYTLHTNSSTDCSATAGSAIGCEFQIWNIATASTTYAGGGDSSGQTHKGTGAIDGFGVSVSGNYAYTTWQNSATTCSGNIGSGIGCEVKVWDITNASSTYAEGMDASGSINSGTGNILGRQPFVSGNYLYTVFLNSATTCANSAGGGIGCELKIFDVTAPTTVTYIGGGDSSGSTNTGTGSGDSGTVFADSTHVYTGWQANGTTCSGTAGSAIGCELKIWEIGVAASPAEDPHDVINSTMIINTGSVILF